ncbi:serine/threonine-protein kinase [Clostridium sp. Mt-5]|uniref:Serine/threonine-protein kinase n=1 Tax=Clostridium moutaii TaxID=3240932 RepID=A0ABV4BLK7_9CLOT
MIITVGSIVYGRNGQQYLIENAINSGGFGIVFKTKRLNDNTIWAIKTIQSNFEDGEQYNAFINEINTSSKIKCENVIQYEFTHDGKKYPELPPYIIMEYANQGDLRKVIDDYKSKKEFIPNELLISFYNQLINGMKSVNSVLVHRDIKPENILISNSQLKISDFGLSKFASEKTRKITFKGYGTYMYVAPEAWNNDKNTIQLDIYSMGIVFYELATLQYPYHVSNTRNLNEWKNAHMFQIPDVPNKINNNISPVISNVIMKMLEKSTSKRFSNWNDIYNYFKTENLGTSTIGSEYINAMLNNRLQKDDSIKREISKKEIQQKKENEFCNLVKYKFQQDIYEPLISFIGEFNSKYPNGNIKVEQIREDHKYYSDEYLNIYSFRIITPSHNTISICLAPVIERLYLGEEKYRMHMYGEQREFTPQMFKIREGKIMAWGYLETKNKTGFNILLVQKDDDMYGKFFIMENSCNGLVREDRQSPFPFTFDELPQKIETIYALSRYNSDISEFNIEKIFSYISMYI